MIALYANGDNATYVDSFEVEFIAKEVEKFIGGKNITRDNWKIQAYDSVICRDTFVLNLSILWRKMKVC